MAEWNQQVWAGLTAAQVSTMSKAQIRSFQSASWLPATAAGGLLPWQMAPLSSMYSQFSADWFNHLQLDSFIALDSGRLNQISTSALSGMDNALLTALSAAQVATMNNPGDMDSKKFGLLNISALSTNHLAAMTLAQYQGLSLAQLSTLSPTQIQSLAHLEWLAPGMMGFYAGTAEISVTPVSARRPAHLGQ